MIKPKKKTSWTICVEEYRDSTECDARVYDKKKKRWWCDEYGIRCSQKTCPEKMNEETT